LRTLGISASPRPNGNSDLLLRQTLAGAEQTGSVVQKVRTYERPTTPPQAVSLVLFHCPVRAGTLIFRLSQGLREPM